jgi:IS30 family transposase
LGRVSHETIYVALYALPRGELRRELLACLRQGRQARRPRSRGSDRRGFVTDDIKIAARPDDIAERLVPGHWAWSRCRRQRTQRVRRRDAEQGLRARMAI